MEGGGACKRESVINIDHHDTESSNEMNVFDELFS